MQMMSSLRSTARLRLRRLLLLRADCVTHTRRLTRAHTDTTHSHTHTHTHSHRGEGFAQISDDDFCGCCARVVVARRMLTLTRLVSGLHKHTHTRVRSKHGGMRKCTAKRTITRHATVAGIGSLEWRRVMFCTHANAARKDGRVDGFGERARRWRRAGAHANSRTNKHTHTGQRAQASRRR